MDNIQQIAFTAFNKGVYKKNIHYIFKPGADPTEFDFVKSVAGSSGMCAWMIQQVYYQAGIQMHISKQVSDDLIASDFSEAASVEGVPWLAPAVELYFEDPLIPTALVMKSTPADIQTLIPTVEVALKKSEYITALMQEGSGDDGKMMSLQLSPDMYDSFLREGLCPPMKSMLAQMNSNLSEEDNCSMSFMLSLALKVFAFASVPQYKPVPISKKQMKFGGKPDVKGRPSKQAFRVQYLPTVVTPKPEHHDGGRNFHGRRGGIRWYRDECFVNKRGTWGIVRPVADPATGKFPDRPIVRVRKPSV